LTETVTIHMASTTSSFPTNDDDDVATQIHFYAMFRSLDDMEAVQHVFNTSEIVVFDCGLHYIPSWHLDLFKVPCNASLTFPGPVGARPHLLIWRDTSIQHFNLPGGHVEPGVADACPLPRLTLPTSVRLSVLHDIATVKNYSTWNGIETSGTSNNNKTSLYIPYREFTQGLVHFA
jgi:hypothetical protein